MRHEAYERLARQAGCAGARESARTDTRRPGPFAAPPHPPGAYQPDPPPVPPSPVPPSVADRTGEPVRARCGTWQSCCFCAAEVPAMRQALRRIAELHSGCRPDCPERRRLASVPRGHRPPH